jgi:hypothetical protein
LVPRPLRGCLERVSYIGLDAFKEIEEDANISIPKICLGTRNDEDILAYIDSRMDEMDIFEEIGPARC